MLLISCTGPRRGTKRAQTNHKLPPVDRRFVAKHGGIGLGGFPGPIELLRRLFKYLAERLGDRPMVQRFKSYPSILLPVGQGNQAQLARYDTKEVMKLLLFTFYVSYHTAISSSSLDLNQANLLFRFPISLLQPLSEKTRHFTIYLRTN